MIMMSGYLLWVIALFVVMDVLKKSDLPVLLQEIPQVPRQLYFKGAALRREQMYVAIVGTRLPSAYGQRMTYMIARALVEAGAVIVSGLAFGVDFLAHKAAVDAGQPTVAFLASGVDKVTPSTHAKFAEQMVKCGGTLVSEYEQFDRAHKYRFLERNRLISGLCKATIVIEAKERSGALITARHAFDQNRDVYALVGDVDRMQSRGCLNLIEKDMARPITSVDGLLRDLGVDKNTGLEMDADSRKVFELLSRRNMSFQKLLGVTKMPVITLNVCLSTLEMKGLIVHSQYGYKRLAE